MKQYRYILFSFSKQCKQTIFTENFNKSDFLFEFAYAQNLPVILSDSNSNDTQSDVIFDENDGDVIFDDNDADIGIRNATVAGPSTKKKTPKRKNSSPLDSEESILFKKALTALDNTEKRDEWDIFGQFVADDLRQISNIIFRNAAKREIMKVLLQYDSLDAPLIIVEEQTSDSTNSESQEKTLNTTM